MSGQGMQMQKGPPYMPTTWTLGGAPSIVPDVPITAVFLFLYVCGAVTHMTIFQLNRKHGHKFLMSGLLFGFCMARIVTTILRIALMTHSTNVRLAIAAQIFVAVGVILVFIINLIFTLRMLRAMHPTVAWHKATFTMLVVIIVLIILTIVALVTSVVSMYYTMDPYIRKVDRDIQLYGATFFAFVAFLPIPLVIGGLLVPRKQKLDKFGAGRWRTKIAILLTSATVLSFGAWYRTGTSFLTPVPRTQPLPAVLGKGPFYVANFTVEVIVIYLYAILRVDKRFHIPNGAKGYGSYSNGYPTGRPAMGSINENIDEAVDEEKELHNGSRISDDGSHRDSGFKVFSEEETFDGEGDGANHDHTSRIV